MATESATARARRLPIWISAVLPVAIMGLLVAGFLVFNPIGSLREVPPVEAVAFERTIIDGDGIELHLRNDGPDPVTISQVLVNDAYWDFTIGASDLGRLETTSMRIPYPWEEGLPLNIALVTSTGLTIEHEIEAAALTPTADVSTFVLYALLGIYIGVIPVLVGLLWFPALRRAGRRWLDFFLAFTVGLLAFLLIDTIAEGLELSAASPAALDGLSLFVLGALAATACLVMIEAALGTRKQEGRKGSLGGLALAYLIAAGIGLHNMGEGLAVGSALAIGEVALGTFLIVGFALHNTTEGLAIVAPLGRRDERPALRHFAGFGLLAGGPTILGAWAGGFAFSAAWAALVFGVAAGAIVQVLWQIGRSVWGTRAISASASVGVIAGFVFMYVTGLLTV